MASATLSSGCGVCGKKDDLSRCAACKVMFYCGREHQFEHRPEHKSACNAIKKHRLRMEEEEHKLRNHPDNFMFSDGDPFVHYVGHFWGLLDTRDYMRARFSMVGAMAAIESVESTQARLDHLLDMLRPCRGDNMGVRKLIPALMLRLHKDQECYDFVKWWAVIDDDSHYDWGNMALPYLDIKNADVFEPVDRFCGEFVDLSHAFALLLLKIKLLFDLMRLEQSTSALLGKVPREILDLIQSFVPQSPVVTARRDLMRGETRQAAIEKLNRQIHKLYKTIADSNMHLLVMLLSPGGHLDARPSHYSRGSEEEMQIVLRYNYHAWAATPGAIEFIQAKLQRDE